MVRGEGSRTSEQERRLQGLQEVIDERTGRTVGDYFLNCVNFGQGKSRTLTVCGCWTNAPRMPDRCRVALVYMYKTTRDITGSTLLVCRDCGHAISINKLCEKPIRAATEMLRHMASHNASRAFVAVGRVPGPEPKPVPVLELSRALGVPTMVDRADPTITEPSSSALVDGVSGFSADQLRLSEALPIM